MGQNIKALIGTSTTMAIADDTGVANGAKIVNDYPPTEESYASAYIHNDGTGGAVVVTLQAQLYSGVDWGPVHACLDEDGDAITFTANVDSDVEVNMYAQAWWKENAGWRIVLSRASSTLIAGTATAVIR